MKISVNMNDECSVRLTPSGIDVLMKNDTVSYQYNFDQKTRILKQQLWVLMQIFGPSLYNGSNHFEYNEIVFKIE